MGFACIAEFIQDKKSCLDSVRFPRYNWSCRAPVSMGAVGASAPTVFESVGASTHGFWQIFPNCFNFHRNDAENITKNSNFLAKSNFKHPQFEIPNGDLVFHGIVDKA